MTHEVKYSKKYDGSIIEFKFVTQFKKGYFKEHITPMVNVIKAMVPSTAREYNPSTFTWSIAAEYWEPYCKILDGLGWKKTEVLDTTTKVKVDAAYAESFYREPEPLPSANAESAEQIRTKLSTLLNLPITTQPVSELKSFYRRKALELHPDRNNGDGSQMSELNRLWSLYQAF